MFVLRPSNYRRFPAGRIAGWNLSLIGRLRTGSSRSAVARFAIIAGVFVVALAAVGPVTAAPSRVQPKPSGQALEVSPTVQQVSIDPGKAVVQQIRIRNITKSELVITSQINDFVPDGETGLPRLILDENAQPTSRSIKGWVTLPASIRLVPREAKTVTVRVNVPKTASPGSHYGVVRFSGRPPGLEGEGVSVAASIGVLEFIRVSGAVDENLKVEEFAFAKDGKKRKLIEAAPGLFVARLNNHGNVDVTPTGQIEIRNIFGRKVAALNVNLPPRIVLPDSIRRFDQPLDKATIGNKILFGRYTADLNLNYGEGKKPVSSKIVFWVIP